MALALWYVDRRRVMMERFIEIIHVRDTSALSLKKAVDSLLSKYSLSLSYIRGQCYDGARASFKRREYIQEDQAKKLQEALRADELEIGRGLNQQLRLKRASETRWGSHYKSLINFNAMFRSLIDVLDNIASDAHNLDDRFKAQGLLNSCQIFDFALLLHLMIEILGVTNELNIALQKKEWDIVNAITLVEMAKVRLQEELNSRFNEVNIDLLLGVATLNSIDKFSNFNLKKILKLAEFATVIAEKAFSFIKNDLRNQMGDEFMNDYMVNYIEKDVFRGIPNDVIMDRFQKMKTHRG
uniref:Uncharacterized protein LOC105050278 n=2 Tax=Elaeis guineensis var. tenera TaxID=51953 RepID=A0A6I9RLU8_ELAGV|nr:uncharacterized protein LOC105050278 [Elaeis guineensis]